MSFIFSLYDFDNDGYISAEDVRIVLSYIPLLRQDLQRSSMSLYESSTSLSQEEDDGPNSVSIQKILRLESKHALKSQIEGLYSAEEGKNLDASDRVEIQK